MAGLVIILFTRFTGYLIVAAIIGSIIGATNYSWWLFHQQQLLFDSTWILFTILIVGLHSIFNRFILEFRLKQQIRKQFETYLDPRQVALLQKSSKLKLGGERKEMSFLFMDIVGFTLVSNTIKTMTTLKDLLH